MQKIKCDVCGHEIELDQPIADEVPASQTPEPSQAPETPEEFSTNDMLTEILLNTREQCTMVDTLIRNQIHVKDEQINKLYSEMQFYKEDHASRFINQVMKAIIKVRKDMIKRASSPEWLEMSVSQVQREFEYAIDDLTELLEQQNIDPYETDPGELFDVSKHQVHKLEPTDDPELDKRIKQSFHEGYLKNGKVFIVERVIVYQYKPQE